MSAQARILCVAKDLGSLAGVGAIAKAAREAGMNVAFVAEGASLPEVEKRFGIKPEACNVLTPTELFGQFQPDVVVVGCSSPINLEHKFAALAESECIPLIIFSDIRGAWRRLEELNGLVLATDEGDTITARQYGFEAEAVGFHQANLPAADADTERLVEAMHDQGLKVILAALSGQPKRVAQELECVLACSTMTDLPHVLVVQANPKILPQEHPAGGTWGEWFKSATEGRAIMRKGPLVRYADMTISPSSGGLTALAAGKIGIGLRPATVEDVLASEQGVLDQLDFYEREIGMPIIRKPINLAPLLAAAPPKVDVKAFDPELALKYIKEFAGIE